MTPLDPFYAVYFKDRVYIDIALTLAEIIAEIPLEICEKVEKYFKFIDWCNQTTGGHINDPVYFTSQQNHYYFCNR